MRLTETLTKLVVGTSRFGEHLLKQKLRGIVVAALAFAFDEGGSPVYTLSLSTPLTKCEWDRQTLEAMLKGWRLQPAE